jgi:hypothetical protein
MRCWSNAEASHGVRDIDWLTVTLDTLNEGREPRANKELLL